MCTWTCVFNAELLSLFQGFHHPGVGYLTKKEWDLSKIHIIKSCIPIATQDDTERKVLTRVYDSFVNNVIPQLKNLTKQTIHGDLNDENILVEPNQCGDGYEVASFIDFGDISLSYRVFEVAICMMYMILQRVRQGDAHDEAVRVAGHVLCGYQSVCSLSQSELTLLYWSVAARFFQSIVNGKYKQSLEPENVCLSNCCDLGLDVLSSYVAMKGEEVLHSWLSLAAKKANI